MTRLACIIPTHNMASTLGRALGSACHQAIDEIVVVDDASTDDTAVVVERYASRFPAVTYVRHAEKAACHITALKPVYDALDADHVLGLSADDIFLPGLATAVRRNIEHGVVFTHYTCEHAGHVWKVTHPFTEDTAVSPGDMRLRVETQQPVETGIGSSVRMDVMRWLWDLGWAELGPHSDSIGYATAACVFGAAYVPLFGAHIQFNPNGYGEREAKAHPLKWAERAFEFTRRAGLDDATARALILKRCGVSW